MNWEERISAFEYIAMHGNKIYDYEFIQEQFPKLWSILEYRT